MPFPSPSEKQARVIWIAATGLAIATIIGLVVALIWGLGRVLDVLAPVLWPIAVAGVLAYLLDPVVDFLERRRIPRTRAIVLVFGVALLIVLGLFGSIVPQVVVQTGQFVSQVPAYATKVQQRVENWATNPPVVLRQILQHASEAGSAIGPATNAAAPVTTTNITNAAASAATAELFSQWREMLGTDAVQSITDWLKSLLPKLGTWLFGQVTKVAGLFGVVVGLALIPIYAFYFLLEKEGIVARWRDYLPVKDSNFKDELVFVLNSVNEYLIAFFRGQVLVAMCDGVLYTIGFTIIGLPYSLLIGVMATFLTIIPFLGAIVTCSSALIIALVAFGDWQHPLLVLVVFGIVQALEGTVISPKIMGHRVGLHPLAIIIALMVGTTLLGGILGGILAIPLAAALRVVMFRYVWKKRSV